MAQAPAHAAFLSPLSQIAARDPDAEALVFWGHGGWQEEPTEDLDAGELPFYVEGLIPEGFHLEWRILGEKGAKGADHIRLYVWEEGTPLPPPEKDWQVLDSAGWPEG